MAPRTLLLVMMSAMAAAASATDLPTQWLRDFDAAKEKAAKEDKPILAVFSTSWCGPCQHMVRNIYPQKEVVAALDKWVPVYIDGDKHRRLVEAFEVPAYPSFVMLSAKGQQIYRHVGGMPNAAVFVRHLGIAARVLDDLGSLLAKIATTPTDGALFRKLGEQLQSAKQAEAATAAFNHALDLDPEHTDGIPGALVGAHQRNTRFKVESARLDQAIADEPENAALRKARGDLYAANFPMLDQSHASRAIEDYQAAIRLDSDDKTGAQAELDLLNLMVDQRQPRAALLRALADWVTANPRSPRAPEVRCMIGVMEGQTGQPAAAIEKLETYLAKHPTGPLAEMAGEMLPTLKGK